MSTTGADELERLLGWFRQYADHEMAALGSPAYAAICDGLARDPGRASLALLATPPFRHPNVLLAAVHHLLLEGARHPLAAYYATVVGDARPPDDALYPAFAGFLDQHRSDVERLIATHTTQTNEVGRSALLLPALLLVQASAGPIALLEVGSSAGLNLFPDRYGYRFGSLTAGDPASPVQLACEPMGGLLPPLPGPQLRLSWRHGVDQNPIDLHDPDNVAWLRALVWPEHTDRMAQLDAAIGLLGDDTPPIRRGDLLETLPRIANEAPAEAALAVTSTSVQAYATPEKRRQLLARLALIAGARGASAWLVMSEARSVIRSLDLDLPLPAGEGPDHNLLTLHRFDADGSTRHVLLSECHAHGRWIRWLDRATGVPRA
jgi:hypothetical protein